MSKKLFVLAAFIAATATMSLVPSPRAAAANCVNYVYAYGGTGRCVKNIQKILNGVSNVYSGITQCNTTMTQTFLSTDGVWGNKTDAKVRQYQRWSCLSADGVVGPQSWRHLCSDAHDMGIWNITYAIWAYSAGHDAGCY